MNITLFSTFYDVTSNPNCSAELPIFMLMPTQTVYAPKYQGISVLRPTLVERPHILVNFERLMYILNNEVTDEMDIDVDFTKTEQGSLIHQQDIDAMGLVII